MSIAPTAPPTPPEVSAPAEAPPTRHPKLSQELRELERLLRANAPDEELRYGTCAGTSKEPHVQELWLTWLDPAPCPACARPLRTWVLEPNGGNGGK